MSSSSSRRSRSFHVLRQPVVVDIGCSCRKPKVFSLLNLSRYNYNLSSSSKSKNKSKSSSESSTCSLTTTITNSTFSPCNDSTTTTSSSYSGRSPTKKKRPQKQKKGGRSSSSSNLLMVEESVAVEKVSSDPYMDFKESMLQMIVEKEIYQWEDLRELLNLFLSLNSPYHHDLILRAFAEIWEGLFSPGPR